LQNARTAGELKLKSADPYEQPIINYNYLSDATDRARMREAVRLGIELAKDGAFDGLIAERLNPTDEDLSSDDHLDNWLLRNVYTQHHSSGTCKMGPDDDPMAVVDQYCRVRGLTGVRVVDASVMPDVIRANTNATTIMIAEKVSEWINQ